MNRLLWTLVLLSSLLPRAFAASYPGHDWLDRRFNPKTVEVRPVEGISERIVDGKLHLHLKDFLDLVLRNSTEVQLTRLDVYTSADQIIASKSLLDPDLSLGFNTLRSISPQFSQIGGAATLSGLTQTSNLNYQQLLPTGQTITTVFNATRTSSNSAFNFYNPNLFGTLNFTIAQPLLQNRTNLLYKAPMAIARTQLLITSEVSQGTIADTVAMAATQYWEAVRARDNIKVQQQTVDLARKSYDRDKQALDLGALAQLDIFQSQAQVAERNRDLIAAQYSYKSALDGLRRLIGADLTPANRAMEIVIEDDPAILPLRTAVLPFEESLAKAKHLRPELSAANRRMSIDDWNARLARDRLTPRLDLLVQASGNGLGGTGVPLSELLTESGGLGTLGPVTALPSIGLGNTLGQLLGFQYPSYGAGLQLTLPIRNSSAQASLSDALVNKVRDRYTERQVEQQITLDVRQAINSIELADATIDAATLARDLARKNVDAEQQKYELGTITAFEVLDAQNRLATAESALLNANVVYQQAYISYQRSTWTLLDNLGIILQVPRVK
jgi:outer membrane protein TolC